MNVFRITQGILLGFVLSVGMTACTTLSKKSSSSNSKESLSGLQIDNQDVRWINTFSGLQHDYQGEGAREILQGDESQIPALLSALSESNRWVTAHVLLMDLSEKAFPKEERVMTYRYFPPASISVEELCKPYWKHRPYDASNQDAIRDYWNVWNQYQTQLGPLDHDAYFWNRLENIVIPEFYMSKMTFDQGLEYVRQKYTARYPERGLKIKIERSESPSRPLQRAVGPVHVRDVQLLSILKMVTHLSGMEFVLTGEDEMVIFPSPG